MEERDEVGINYTKYANKEYIHHVVDPGEREQPYDPEQIEHLNKIKDVCLNCKKKKCTGTKLCYEKEREKKWQEG